MAKLEADVGAMSMSSDQELLAVEAEIQQLNFEYVPSPPFYRLVLY